MLIYLTNRRRSWAALEASVVTYVGRINAAQELVRLKNMKIGWCKSIFGCTVQMAALKEAQLKVKFMLLRTEFVHFVDGSGTIIDETLAALQASVAPLDKAMRKSMQRHLREQFRFHLYLTKVTADRLAAVVEVSALGWLFLLAFAAVVVSIVVTSSASWQTLLIVWVSSAWTVYILLRLYQCKLSAQLGQMYHLCGGMSLVQEGGWEEKLPLSHQQSIAQSTTKASPSWISTRPRYIYEQPPKPTSWLPRFLIGEPGRTPQQQQMLNVMIFGCNEACFQRGLLRFVYYAIAVYTAVFGNTILYSYVAEEYHIGIAALIGTVGMAPVLLLLTGDFYSILEDSVLLTSIDHMRARRAVDEVARISREVDAVSLVRLAAVLKTDGFSASITKEQVKQAEQAVILDEECKRRGRPTTEVEEHVRNVLKDRSAELIVARLLSIFDGFDRNRSGVLSINELKHVFDYFGFTHEEIEGCMITNLDNIDAALYLRSAAVEHSSNAGCGGGKSKGCMGGRFSMNKALFLAWFLHFTSLANKRTSKEIADVWFEMIDGRRSGKISVGELQAVLAKSGRKFTSSDATSLLLELDTNDDGYFDKAGLIKWLDTNTQY